MDSIWALVIAFRIMIQRLTATALLVTMLCICGLFLPANALAAVYLTPVKFVSQNFTQPPISRNLWLSDEHQETAKLILGHQYRGLRIRYWQSGARSAWVLGEIGKEKPITVGVVVNGSEIEKVTILEYRETRGGEVRHPFFTRQFTGLSLMDNMKLSGSIDGITGATLSVRAVSNVSRYALFLHRSLYENVESSRQTWDSGK